MKQTSIIKVKNILCRYVSKKRLLVVLATFATIVWVWSLSVPSRVNFSYAGETCKTRLVPLPFSQQSNADNFRVSYKDTFQLGRATLLASKVCFNPKTAPKQGEVQISSKLFDSSLFRTRYVLRVPRPASVARVASADKLAITKPINFALDTKDEIFSYKVTVGALSQPCAVLDARITCWVDKLHLTQGAEHKITLVRSFAGKAVQELQQRSIVLLPAVQVTGSSVNEGQMLYANTSEFWLKTSTPVKDAAVLLETLEGTTASAVESSVETKGDMINIKTSKALPHEKSYRLTLRSVTTADGTDLEKPHIVSFQTSGGPKVTGVNIGASNVDTSARVVISFDQPLDIRADVTKYASIEGGKAALSVQGDSIVFALQSVPRCTPFTLLIAKGLPAENGLEMKDAWSHSSRTSCRSSSTIGYSVNGRPIVAYYYGSGSTSILFTGGIHGSEPSGSYIMQDWVAHLDANAHKIPTGRQVVVVPSLSPDGLAAGSRLNANGVNLDRNFPTSNWTKDIITSGGSVPGGGGKSPLSEPEAQAIADLTTQLRPRLEVSFHSQGSLVGANACSASASVARQYAKAVGYGTMIGNAEEVMGYAFTGEYEEWMCEKFGTTSILIELPTHTGRYFSKHLDALWQMVNY
ncbi:DUF2817 domain-containing protein [Candidatus Saccharibacteria bacterium]|nr:DUF2817 domain-containing protein [Candidatus Saccharibacteria bacterium]